MSTQRPSIHQTQSWVNTALSFICLLCSGVCMWHCFTQFIHSSTDGKCNKMVHWMLMASEECLGETHVVLCQKTQKGDNLRFFEMDLCCVSRCYLCKSLETEKQCRKQHIHLFIWKMLLSRVTYNWRLWAVLKGSDWQQQEVNSQPSN